MKDIHNRMPVILPEDAYQNWLEPGEKDPAQLSSLLGPFPSELMTAHPVSALVNNPRNDLPQCIAPIA
jgi:putative SOS response-associated peptidase YedK